jgi:hypothetical protein
MTPKDGRAQLLLLLLLPLCCIQQLKQEHKLELPWQVFMQSILSHISTVSTATPHSTSQTNIPIAAICSSVSCHYC